MMKEKDIIDAWATIREENNTIPDEVLDFMKRSAIERLSAPAATGEEWRERQLQIEESLRKDIKDLNFKLTSRSQEVAGLQSQLSELRQENERLREERDEYAANYRNAVDVGTGWVQKINAFLKELIDVRNKLYNELPTGEISAFELISVIKGHCNDLDNLMKRITDVTPKSQPDKEKEAVEDTLLRFMQWYNDYKNSPEDLHNPKGLKAIIQLFLTRKNDKV